MRTNVRAPASEVFDQRATGVLALAGAAHGVRVLPRAGELDEALATLNADPDAGLWLRMGTPADPDSSSEAFVVATDRTITVQVAWEAQCLAPDGSQIGVRVGNARATLLPKHAGAFSFDVARDQIQTDAWGGSVSGTVSAAAITLSIQATGSFDGQRCDTGPLSFTLNRRTDQIRVHVA